MKDIINLMKLDLICIKKKTLVPLLAAMAFFAVFGFYMGPQFMMAIIIFSGLCVQSMFTIAAKNDFNKLYGVLPVSRSSVVFARFLLGVVSVGIVTAVMVVLGLIADKAALFEKTDEQLAQFYYASKDDGFTIPMMGAILFAATCILMSIQYMIVFILGVERETMGMLCAVIITAVMMFIIVAVNIEITTGAADLLSKIYLKSEYLLYAAIYAFGLLVAFIFSLITGAVMKRREL
ncbi:MAG: ABC-2 transporter permease [Oscillospiraceae bacterium]